MRNNVLKCGIFLTAIAFSSVKPVNAYDQKEDDAALNEIVKNHSLRGMPNWAKVIFLNLKGPQIISSDFGRMAGSPCSIFLRKPIDGPYTRLPSGYTVFLKEIRFYEGSIVFEAINDDRTIESVWCDLPKFDMDQTIQSALEALKPGIEAEVNVSRASRF